MGLGLLLAAVTAAVPVGCPQYLQDVQRAQLPADANAVWYYKGPRRLRDVGLFIGHPSQRGEVRGDDWSEKNVTSWIFSKRNDTWLECGYEDSAAVVQVHIGNASSCKFVRGQLGKPARGECIRGAP